MYSYEHFIHVRCVGALIRKPHSWPPHSTPVLSAARRLAERRGWQPRIWRVAQRVREEVQGMTLPQTP